jgi:polygalacturonase
MTVFHRKITLLLLPYLLFSVQSLSQTESGIYDPYNYGAKGDGQTNDTKAIQTAIDNCNLAGGGKVFLHNGQFLSGTVYIKNNVTLYIEAGAVLLGSKNLDDYPVIPSAYQSYKGKYVTNKMLIYAEDANNISICGTGTINGGGDNWVDEPYGSPSFSVRPRIIHFRGCGNVIIRDVTLQNSASWVQSYQSCHNLVIDGITVRFMIPGSMQ